MQEWKDFNEGIWTECIDVEDFILKNYHEYKGDDSFLEGINSRTSNGCSVKKNCKSIWWNSYGSYFIRGLWI